MFIDFSGAMVAYASVGDGAAHVLSPFRGCAVILANAVSRAERRSGQSRQNQFAKARVDVSRRQP